jgi:RimJ/RimL family protein N-acetyltransferase
LSKLAAAALGLGRTSSSDLADLVPGTAVLTPRLEVRLPNEPDRTRFVELFCDRDFMVFSQGALSTAAAQDRFDEMLARGAELAFAKQPVIERSTAVIVGYAGVDWFDFEGRRRLEFGYRLVPEARGVGYATEASRAVVTKAAETFHGEILAMIDPTNRASQNVARKLGFAFWKQAVVDGYLDNIYRLHIDSADAVTPR